MINQKILLINDPYELFDDKDKMHEKFKDLAKIYHPDKHLDPKEKAIAEKIFAKITSLYELAKNGKKPLAIKVGEYTISKEIYKTDYHTYFGVVAKDGTKSVAKAVNSSSDNDLIANEAEALKAIGESDIVPKIATKFSLTGNKSGLVFKNCDFNKYHTIQDILKENPNGIDSRDMAWMFRRMILIAHVAYINGMINGAIVPTNILFNLENHTVFMPEWGFAAGNSLSKKHVPAIYSDFESIYPEEILKKVPSKSSDIAMAAKIAKTLSSDNKKINNFLNWCAAGPNHRPDSPALVDQEFVKLIESLFGKRVFRNFSINKSMIERY